MGRVVGQSLGYGYCNTYVRTYAREVEFRVGSPGGGVGGATDICRAEDGRNAMRSAFPGPAVGGLDRRSSETANETNYLPASFRRRPSPTTSRRGEVGGDKTVRRRKEIARAGLAVLLSYTRARGLLADRNTKITEAPNGGTHTLCSVTFSSVPRLCAYTIHRHIVVDRYRSQRRRPREVLID